ncbi:NANOG neighbor homeobox-like [Ornithorhynchus anatinus]|uniref:NANOG neighbor homeobox-like n=1 Tax=Ornithorhynchus anatinus TaxID=9258 RepID=UPI0019D4711E|nr:NANOG neighbor homeobox-like [Ornithorhynchus anatinus]
MAPLDQTHGSGSSSGLISIARNNDEGNEMEKKEEEGKERNVAKRKMDRVVVHKTSQNRPVSKSIMETLWMTFKMKHRVRTPEAVRLAGDLAISVPQVTAWFQSTRRKYREMATVQRRRQSLSRMKSPVTHCTCSA